MNNETVYLVIGGLLTIVGGAINDSIRSYTERRRERKAIKISIADELGEIETAIKNMHEVWGKSKILHPSYVADLLSSTSTYDGLRTRLFLIKDKELRKELVAFYKKLKDLGHKSEGKLGTLAETTEASAEQASFESEFYSLCTEAKSIKEKLEV